MIGNKLIVAGIGTDVGKTVVSAILVKLLGADYWKPISCGTWKERDTEQIACLVGEEVRCHPEAYHFEEPLSPHHAARVAGENPRLEEVVPPQTDNPLVIESAGGVFCPFNDYALTIDLFETWQCPWVLVSKNYLGSINHTLLTVEALRQRKQNLLGIVFNGSENVQSEQFITRYTQLPVMGRVQQEQDLQPSVIGRYAEQWKTHPLWNECVLPLKKTKNSSGTPTPKLVLP